MQRCNPFLAFLFVLTLGPGTASAAAVIHVSVDGLRGDLLATMLAEDSTGTLPAFARIRAEGATTFNARTDATHTNTLPNHVSMLTGRPVSQPAGQPNTVHHGYVANDDPAAGETLHNSGNPNLAYVAGIFDVVHDAGLRTALFASKSKFVLFEHSWDAVHGAPDAAAPDHGRDKIDAYGCIETSGTPPTSAAMHATLLAELAAAPPAYCFVHYADLDVVGHASGWGSTAWRQSVRTIDQFLGQILDLVDADPRYAGRTTVVVTADHGGTGTGHSDASRPANFTIPFLVYGAGVKRGADLYALNTAVRSDPGTGNPAYGATLPPVRNGDAANLALTLLRLPPVPGSTINAVQDLGVHEPVHVTPASWSKMKRAFR